MGDEVDQTVTSLYAATDSGLHVWGAAERRELEGLAVNALHVGAEGERWALVDGSELWHDSGNGWESVARSGDLRLNCVGVAGGVWVGASEARLLRLEKDTLRPAPTFDEAPGKDRWFTPWDGPPDVRSLAGSDSHLYANVHVGGILRSTPEGSSWQPTIDIGSDVHEITIHEDDDALVLAATAWGLARSKDAGESWEFDAEGLHATYARAIAIEGDDVFMTACDGPFGGRAALYRGSMSGAGLTKCDGGLPEWFDKNIDTGCVAASRADVAFGTQDGQVFLSSDNGKSWGEVGVGLAPVRWVEFGLD